MVALTGYSRLVNESFKFSLSFLDQAIVGRGAAADLPHNGGVMQAVRVFSGGLVLTDCQPTCGGSTIAIPMGTRTNHADLSRTTH